MTTIEQAITEIVTKDEDALLAQRVKNFRRNLEALGYVIIKESDRLAMQEKAWKYDELAK